MIFHPSLIRSNNSIIAQISNWAPNLFIIYLALNGINIMWKKGLRKDIVFGITALMLFVFIGFLGWFLNSNQPVVAVLIDVFQTTRFWISFIMTIQIFSLIDFEWLLSKMDKTAKIGSILFFGAAIISQVMPTGVWTTNEARFGINAFRFFYPHPNFVMLILVLFLSIILLVAEDLKSCKRYILFITLPLILTLRTKAIGVLLLFLLIYTYFYFEIKRGKFALLFAIAFIVILVEMYTGSFELYFMDDYTARNRLTRGGFYFANKFFPLGTGFAGFGTGAAATYYSQFYRHLGFNSVFGLGRVHTNFANDTFWPAIIGQFGYFGLLIYISLLTFMLIKAVPLYEKKTLFLAFLTPNFYLLGTSIASSAFLSPYAVLYGAICGLAYCKRKELNLISKITEDIRGE